MPRYKLRTLLILLAIGTPVLALGCALVPTIPARDMTVTAIVETKVRIHLYMVAHRQVPPNLSALPKREGYTNQITDGWGRVLSYSIDKDGVISLTSFGRDGKQGGTGDDADITQRYRTRHADGSLNIDDPNWIVNAEIREAARSP